MQLFVSSVAEVKSCQPESAPPRALQLEGVLVPPDFHIQLAYQDLDTCMPMGLGYHDANAAGPGSAHIRGSWLREAGAGKNLRVWGRISRDALLCR